MGVVDNRVFQSGDNAAVILPRDIAFAPGTLVTIERDGDVMTIRPVKPLDPVEDKRRLSEMIAKLRALGPADEVEIREPFDFPERPGM